MRDKEKKSPAVSDFFGALSLLAGGHQAKQASEQAKSSELKAVANRRRMNGYRMKVMSRASTLTCMHDHVQVSSGIQSHANSKFLNQESGSFKISS